MAENNINQILMLNLKSILPHLEDYDIDIVVDFLMAEGVRNESDLLVMTIPIMKAKLTTVDASRVCTHWQAKYGAVSNPAPNASANLVVPVNVPSTSSMGSTASHYSAGGSEMPDFTNIDSPFIPAGVRVAILKKKRPKPLEREDFVTRIVDHTREVVNNLERKMFNKIADSIVERWKESFQDSIIVDKEGKGSAGLRSQLLNKFDNTNRKVSVLDPMRQNASNMPQAYGCIQWCPPLPDGQTEESQEDIRKTVKKIHDLGERRWEWRTIRGHLEDSFYLQRKEINGEPQEDPKKKTRKRKAQAMSEEHALTAAVVVPVNSHIQRWPFLMESKGMSCHFKKLTGVNFEESLTEFISLEGKRLVEFLSCKSEQLGRMRRTMARHEATGVSSSNETTLIAVVLMLVDFLKEDINAFLIMVEDTVTFDEVTDELLKANNALKDGAPLLVISGTSPYDYSDIFLFVDNKVLTSIPNWTEALVMFFESHFVFNLKYSIHVQTTMTFIQRVIAEINPTQTGHKCTTSAEEKKATKKALALNNNFVKFKEDEEDEPEKENNPPSRKRK